MTAFSPGDILEIGTEAGIAYLHLTHRHHAYPDAVRGLGLFEAPVEDAAGLAGGDATFTALVPLAAALGTLGLSARVAARAPTGDLAYPKFRMPIRDRAGAVVYWWVWDGSGLTYTAEADDTLPAREVLSAAAFRERLLGQ